MKISSQKSKVLLLLSLAGPGAWALSQTQTTLVLNGKRLTARHAYGHRPVVQAIHIADSEGCEARTTGATQVEVSDRCQYLRGLYRYVYVPEGQTERHQVLVGFALSKGAAQSYTLLTDMPVELRESTFAQK